MFNFKVAKIADFLETVNGLKNNSVSSLGLSHCLVMSAVGL